jgi:DNA (cytosine-5)-methyltransferase 1
MWPQAIRAVREIAPQAFVFENVRGLMRPRFAHYLASIVEALSEPGGGLRYGVSVQLVNAADFGAAQKRHRVIISGVLGGLNGEGCRLISSHSRDRLLWDQWVSGEYWRDHGIKRNPDSFDSIDRGAVLRLRKCGVEPTERRWVTVRDCLAGLGDPNGSNGHTMQFGARTYPGHTGSPLDQPAKALKAGDHGVPGGENMMVQDDCSVRYFTVREAARLQGLPDAYEFPRSWTESMRQLGNAVPVQLSEAVGNSIRKIVSQAKGKIAIAA